MRKEGGAYFGGECVVWMEDAGGRRGDAVVWGDGRGNVAKRSPVEKGRRNGLGT